MATLALYLIRHGIAADRGEDYPDDSKRPLTTAGIAALRKEADALIELEVTFDVMLVPHTIDRTVLRDLSPLAPLNIEVDVLARYVARQIDLGAVPSALGPGETGRGPAQRPGEKEEKEGPHEDERLLAKLRTGGYL